jgi:hypothetical protein
LPYQITNWNVHFENNRTRELKRLEWVPVPNSIDNLGYIRLVTHPNGAAHLGAWLAILEVASRQKVRGTLPQDGAGLSQSLAAISRLPASVFDEVLPRLLELQWIQEYGEMSQEGAEIPQAGAEKPALKGIELNGTEGKEHIAPTGAGESVVRSALPARRKTQTLEEVRVLLGIRLPWFEHLCAVHPAGKEGVKAAALAFAANVTPDEAGRTKALEMWHGAKAYAERCAADPSTRVKWMQGWINDERWRDANAIPIPITPRAVGRESFVESVTRVMGERIARGQNPL